MLILSILFFALRSYYNLDLDVGFDHGSRVTSPFNPTAGYNLWVSSHTLNLDSIMTAYRTDQLAFDFVLGLGAGLQYGRYTPQYDRIQGLIASKKSYFLDYDLRANAGMRLKWNEYVFELMAKVPFLPVTLRDLNAHRDSFSLRSYYLTLDFVVEL